MELSARNQLAGTVKSIQLDGVMAEVIIELPGGEEIVAAVTRAFVERLNLRVGDKAAAIVKATEVLVGKLS